MIKTITQIPEPIQTPITILKASNAVRSNKQTNKQTGFNKNGDIIEYVACGSVSMIAYLAAQNESGSFEWHPNKQGNWPRNVIYD